MKHHVRTAGRLVSETMARSGRDYRAVFVTLTYRAGSEYQPRQVADYLKKVRKWAGVRGFRPAYVWVAETQKRGAVHYHLVLWLPRGVRLPRPDKGGRWPHGSSNVQSVKRNAVGYLMKYVSKGLGNYPDLPPGARVCGSGGLDAMARDEFHYWRLPRYVRENVQIGERCTRAVGGGWASRDTGQVWQSDFSPWGFAKVKRGLDCNGRPLRADTVVVLSDEYGRKAGATWVVVPEVLERYEQAAREASFDLIRQSFTDIAVRFAWLESVDRQ